MDVSVMSDLFTSTQPATSGPFCFNYNSTCSYYTFEPCNVTVIHSTNRYDDPSAVWVLISAIIVFFMKAGFMLVEISFAQSVVEKRHVVVVKYLDVFASSFGFFLIGFDFVSQYSSPQNKSVSFFQITDPVLWFFKFTFASNAATIIGGCLVTNKYKLRLPAAFISAFVISGVIHPIIARLIWTDKDSSMSPYRFCSKQTSKNSQGFNCTGELSFYDRLYILDFAGGGAVHLLGGVAGLVLCLFAKLQKCLDNRKRKRKNQIPEQHGGLKSLFQCCVGQKQPVLVEDVEQTDGIDEQEPGREEPDTIKSDNFWDWMYPVDGGGETTSEAALGVLILWFCWFAFNCGSTESVQSTNDKIPAIIPYHAIPSIIAVNMILAGASGGLLAVIIAVWAQLRSSTECVNANEIANGVLSSLVAITAGCPFVSYWGACIIGLVAVILYHFGCWIEYRLGIEDTARVVPVHGMCGLWSLLSVGFLVVGGEALCNLHATFEGLCYCELRLPILSYIERLASQIVGAIVMIGITAVICVVMYGTLFLIPINLPKWFKGPQHCTACFRWFMRYFFHTENLGFEGNWLLTSPDEKPARHITLPKGRTGRDRGTLDRSSSSDDAVQRLISHRAYGATNERRETLGTVKTDTAENSKPPTVTFSSREVVYSSQHSRNPVTPQRPASFVSSQQPSAASSQRLTARSSHINSGTNSCNLVAEVYMSDEERAANL